MKIIVLTLLAIFTGVAAHAQPFVTTWKTDNLGGLSGPNQIIIPTDDLTSLYDIHWEEVGVPANNGNLNNQAGPVTITFPSPGTYRVEITGNFTHIYFYNNNNPSDHQKILTVEQWGSIVWQSMFGAFNNCSNLTVPASDQPNLSNVTNMSMMFQGATIVNPNMGGWDVSNVTQMFGLFQFATAFNHDIGAWNVSNVTNMRAMFSNAQEFNQDISGWDIGSVTDISAMFFNAVSFNQDIGGWNTSNVTTSEGMFFQASAFNQDIGSWNVSNVTDMTGMFYQAASFNQDLSAWDVGNVISMGSMFAFAPVFNSNLSGWDVSSVTNMAQMFMGASAFNQDLNTWNVGNVTNTTFMFSDATAFNSNIDNWNVGNVTNMRFMFAGAFALNRNIGGWNVSNVTNMQYMFASAIAFNQDIGNWNVSKVTDMYDMFGGATVFNQDISNWDVSHVTTMAHLFAAAEAFDQDINGWDVSSVTDMSAMFQDQAGFNHDINNWDVSNVTNMQGMFINNSTFDKDISAWDLSNVTNMAGMFDNSAFSMPHYDAFLISLAAKNFNNTVTLGAAGLEYCSAATARQTLIVSRNWTITGDSEGCIEPPPPLFLPEMNVVRNGQPLAEGTSVSFPNTGVGLSTNQVFRIKNIGQATLVITDVQVTGDNFSLVGTIPSLISAGDSSSFEVRFEPTDLTTYTGTLSIFSNDDVPVYTLNISGEGDAEIEVYNVVTVNKNGKHDFLNIRNIELFPQNRVTIYDRWGNLVYEREGYNNIDDTFEGATNGNKVLPEGTYYYVVDKNNGSANKTGFLLLRR